MKNLAFLDFLIFEWKFVKKRNIQHSVVIEKLKYLDSFKKKKTRQNHDKLLDAKGLYLATTSVDGSMG